MRENLLPVAIVVGALVVFGPVVVGRAFKAGRLVAVLCILVLISAPGTGMQVVDLARALVGEVIRTATDDSEPVAVMEDLQWVEGNTTGTWSIRIREVRAACTPDGIRVSLRGGDSHPVEHQIPDPITMRLRDGTEVVSQIGPKGWTTWTLDAHTWVLPHDATGPATILIPAGEAARFGGGEPVRTEAVDIRVDLPPVECGSEPE